MNADTAAAIGSICAAIVSIAVVVGQVLLSRRIGEVHSLVNGQSHTLNRLYASEAYQRGAASATGPTSSSAPGAPPQIEPR